MYIIAYYASNIFQVVTMIKNQATSKTPVFMAMVELETDIVKAVYGSYSYEDCSLVAREDGFHHSKYLMRALKLSSGFDINLLYSGSVVIPWEAFECHKEGDHMMDSLVFAIGEQQAAKILSDNGYDYFRLRPAEGFEEIAYRQSDMSATDFVKKMGLSGTFEMAELSGESTQNLNNWYHKRRRRFDLILKGLLAEKGSEELDELLHESEQLTAEHLGLVEQQAGMFDKLWDVVESLQEQLKELKEDKGEK